MNATPDNTPSPEEEVRKEVQRYAQQVSGLTLPLTIVRDAHRLLAHFNRPTLADARRAVGRVMTY
jgi:hypothetical protein